MNAILCPRCIAPMPTDGSDTCTRCKMSLTRGTVRTWTRSPPHRIALVGYSLHGKTTFLQTFCVAAQRLNRLKDASRFYLEALDAWTLRRLEQMGDRFDRAILPGADKVSPPARTLDIGPDDLAGLTDDQIRDNPEIPTPLVLDLHGAPLGGADPSPRISLILQDVAGELFLNPARLARQVPSLAHTQTIWFIVSLPRLLQDDRGRNMFNLFHSYFQAMDQLRQDLRGRRLVIVYSMADRFEDFAELLRDVPGRLFKENFTTPDLDPFSSITGPVEDLPAELRVDRHAERISAASESLVAFTRSHPLAGGLVNAAEARGMSIRACVVSATGVFRNVVDGAFDHTKSGPEPNTKRYGMLDPLLLTITQPDRLGGPPPLNVIIDQRCAARPEVAALLDRLAARADLRVGYLGARGLRPRHEAAPPDALKPRLLGPVMEAARTPGRAVVITDGEVLDLLDFVGRPGVDLRVVAAAPPGFTNAHVFLPEPLGPTTDAAQLAARLAADPENHDEIPH